MRIRTIIFLMAALMAACVVSPLPAAAQEGTQIDIQVDCGDNATYNKDYKVCFCDTGYHASDDGSQCVKDDDNQAVKKSPVVEYEEPAEPEAPKEVAKPAPVPEPEPAPAPEKPAPAPVPTSASVSAPAPAPKPISKTLKPGEFLLRRGTTVKLELIETVNSQTHAEGDDINFRVVDEVVVDSYVVVKAGAEAFGKVIYAKPAKSWGRSGAIEIAIESLEALDGTQIPLTARITEEEDWSPYAGGKILLSTIVAGPLGLATGGGMKGKKSFIDKGTHIAVFVAEDMVVKSDKKVEIKRPVVPSYEASPASAANPEDQARRILQGCYQACKVVEDNTFNTCMDKCKTECADICLGLEGADLSGCLGKCAGVK